MTDATNTEAKYILESVVEEREAALKEALGEMLTSHFNLYKSVFGENSDPEDDLVRIKARKALEKTA